MHIELIDLLRCPRPHEDSWLVASFARMDGRLVVEGTLGCPVCGERYAIRDGIPRFDAAVEAISGKAGGEVGAGCPVPVTRNALPDTQPGISEPAAEGAMRMAAMLSLTRPGGLAVLEGETSRFAGEVRNLAAARVIALNPPAGELDEQEGIAAVECSSAVPLARGSADGVALDGSAAPSLVLDMGRVLRPGGRLVVAPGTQLPPAFRELARDERYVVAELTGELVKLSR